MTLEELLVQLEAECQPPHGFVGQIRAGVLDYQALQRFLALLASVPPHQRPLLDRRLVAWLWWIPSLMLLKRDLAAAKGTPPDHLERAATQVIQAVERILGLMDELPN